MAADLASAPETESGSSARRVTGAAGVMMAAILASRVLGLLRDAIISGKFGQGYQSDIYYAAFVIPDLLFFLIAGGALSSSFIPVFTEYISTGREEQAWKVFSTVASVMTVVVLCFIAAGEVFTYPLVELTNWGFPANKVADSVPLTRILLPAQLCFFLGGLMMGTQNVHGKFGVAALGPVIYNLGIIFGGLFLTRWLGVAGLCWGALIGAVVGNLGLQVYGVYRLGARFRPSFEWRHPDVMKVWKLMLPVILGLALPQVSIQFNKMFASSLGDGPQSALTRANQLMQVPLGVFAQATAVAIFPTLSAMAAQKRFADLRSTASMGIRFILFLTIPSSLFMIVLAVPIIQVLLQHGQFTAQDTQQTAQALAYYAVGIFAWSAQSVLARGFYALQDTRTPVLIGTGVTIFFIPLNWLFMTPLGLGFRGLALATTVAAILHMVVMTYVLRRRLGGLDGARLASSAGKILAAAAVASAACWAAVRALDAVWHGGGVKIHGLGSLGIGLGIGILVYAGCAILVKTDEMRQVASVFRRGRSPAP